jgi:hypothetical protein
LNFVSVSLVLYGWFCTVGFVGLASSGWLTAGAVGQRPGRHRAEILWHQVFTGKEKSLPRLHLFEILDQQWCPSTVRDGATDCLEAVIGATDVYGSVREEMLNAIQRTGAIRVVDLCSGGGGPWLSQVWTSRLDRELDLRVALTDKFPSRVLCERLGRTSRITSFVKPVDATNVPQELSGFRTVFSSFHHFPDAMASKILADAVAAGEGFASAEATSRSVRALLTMFLVPLLAWVLTPAIRPFRWSRIFLTYVLPVIPFVLLWDGIVSCLRTRTPEELLALARPFGDFHWNAGYSRGSWLPAVYLIGIPRKDAAERVA